MQHLSYKVTTPGRGGGRGGYSLLVADHDDEDGWHAAQDDDDSQGQQCPLRVAHGLRLLLHVGHHVRRADLQDSPALAQVGLELLVDIQQFAIQEPSMAQEHPTIRAKFMKRVLITVGYQPSKARTLSLWALE